MHIAFTLHGIETVTSSRPISANPTRLIAFYLPQYHPIPENNQWWGEGFTDWLNVVRGRPLFPGHQQPHLPADLGFYDLRLAATREAQADLARAYGIHGFCYYHYWFGGKRLLSQPLDEVLSSGKPDFPFCLCWANENWTRSWDGLNQNVLVNTVSSADDDLAHINWLADVLQDPRYIRVDGKPLLLVYRVSKLADAKRTVVLWRQEARRLGIGEIFLASVESSGDDRLDPALNGFDASVEFQPDWLTLGSPSRTTVDGMKVFSYGDVVERMLGKPPVPYRRFPCVVTDWDNTPRRPHGAVVLDGSRPELYEIWLREVLVKASAAQGQQGLVFLNAWNEWAEGAHLEPCQRWGHAYLEATRRAHALSSGTAPPVSSATKRFRQSARKTPAVSVCIPTFNGEGVLNGAIESVLAQSESDFELVIVDDASEDRTLGILRQLSDSRVRTESNSRRLGAVANWNRCLDLARGEFVCIFRQDGVMAPDNLKEKVRVLEANPGVGMVHSNARRVTADGNVLSNCWCHALDSDASETIAGEAWFARLLTGANEICAASVILRRDAVLAVGGFDTLLPLTADWEMWMRISLFFDVAYLADPLVSQRCDGAAIVSDFPDARSLEESFAAKWAILTKYPDRIPAADSLRPVVALASKRQALEAAAQCIKSGDSRDAIRYFDVAAAITDVVSDASSSLTRTGTLRSLFQEVISWDIR